MQSVFWPYLSDYVGGLASQTLSPAPAVPDGAAAQTAPAPDAPAHQPNGEAADAAAEAPAPPSAPAVSTPPPAAEEPQPAGDGPVEASGPVWPAELRADLPLLESLIGDCPAALGILRNHEDPGSWRHWFDIANQLHISGNLLAAAKFYLRSAAGHPFPQNVLAAQMTCEIKAGRDPSPDSLDRLLKLDDSHHAFILGLQEFFRPGASPARVLELMGNSYESFHTGTEADCFFLKAATAHFTLPEIGRRLLKPYGGYDRQQVETMPRRLHFYWNRNPPQDIADNFDYHRQLGFFDVHVYDRQRAEVFLYDYYGREAKSTFVALRHPAEEADFLRPHLIYAYGGHYLDADIRIRSVRTFLDHVSCGSHAVFALTAGGLVHNDYFCAERELPVMSSIIQTILHNCNHFPGLSIDLKTGPGAFTRGLNRVFYRALAFNAQPPAIRIMQQDTFDTVFDDFKPAYKTSGMHWGVTLR